MRNNFIKADGLYHMSIFSLGENRIYGAFYVSQTYTVKS